MNGFPTRQQIENYRKLYPAGTRVQLDEMPDDPFPVKKGTKGTILMVDDGGNAIMKWDSGESLSLVIGHDRFHVLSPEKLLIGCIASYAIELHNVNEVADFIIKYGKTDDLTILDENGDVFIRTLGVFLDKIADMDYRAELLKVLIPMQKQYESSILSETADTDGEEISDLDMAQT